jgi:hypothetical protein
MWKSFIGHISPDYTFNAPASENEILGLEEALNVKLSDELKSLLRESNGVDEQYGALIWSVNRIIEENVSLRSYPDFKDLYMPFDCLLFVADAGNGDLFGYSVLNGAIQKDDIFVWNHEDDSRTWVAPSLQTFIEWWTGGKISV